MIARFLLFVIVGAFLVPSGPLQAQTEDGRFFLNSLKQFGGDYSTDNANTANSFLLGRDNAETFQIFRQDSGDQSTFCGSNSWNDCYIFLQSDANGNDPDGAVLFGGLGKDDVFEPHLMIDGGGKIGVGTTHPHEKFSVAGKVLAEEVIVKPRDQWSDYVFEEGYDLPTLKEVSSFIDEEGHLPSVPAAEEVEENGLRLGEMDATLLRKVEELTLYAIEQNKRAERQADRNDRQAAQIDSLRAENETLRRRLRQQARTNRQQQKQLQRQQRQIQRLIETVQEQE